MAIKPSVPTPVIDAPYPSSPPVARWKGPNASPPHVVPQPGPFTRLKTGLPNLPSVYELFHKPRNAGNGNG